MARLARFLALRLLAAAPGTRRRPEGRRGAHPRADRPAIGTAAIATAWGGLYSLKDFAPTFGAVGILGGESRSAGNPSRGGALTCAGWQEFFPVHLSLTRQEIVDAARASFGLPEATLYARLGLTPGVSRVQTEVGGQRWTPRLLVTLALSRRGQARPVYPLEAQNCLKAAGLPLIESPPEEAPVA